VSRVLFTSKSLLAAGRFEIDSRPRKNANSSRPSDLSVEALVTVAVDPQVMATAVIDSVDRLSDGAPSLFPRQNTAAAFWTARAPLLGRPKSETLLTGVRVASK
jgi:hypothetical protein